MEKHGIASIAILPSGSISGHFVDTFTFECFGLFGTQIDCERECSRGEDYKLIKLSILDFNSRKEVQVIVESHGQDAARFENATNIHGWEEDIINAVQHEDQGMEVPVVKFECEILKADEDAEHHIQKYLPSLAGRGAIVNVGTMGIKGLNFDSAKKAENTQHQHQMKSVFDTDSTSHDEFELIGGLRDKTALEMPISNSSLGELCPSWTTLCKTSSESPQEERVFEAISKHGVREETLAGCRQK